jgi:hypothetical protein
MSGGAVVVAVVFDVPTPAGAVHAVRASADSTVTNVALMRFSVWFDLTSSTRGRARRKHETTATGTSALLHGARR